MTRIVKVQGNSFFRYEDQDSSSLFETTPALSQLESKFCHAYRAVRNSGGPVLVIRPSG